MHIGHITGGLYADFSMGHVAPCSIFPRHYANRCSTDARAVSENENDDVEPASIGTP